MKIHVECSPTTGLDTFITITHGYAIIALIRISSLTEFGESLEAIHSFLAANDGVYLTEQVTFGVSVGGAVWCPFGYVPIIVGVGPPDATKDAQAKYGITPSRPSYC